LGGSHFTKALTKELRLTFAKAEHLKKNATQAEDPKAVFQAMRPVFNDLLTQIQRSIGYFTSIDREAKIGRVIALGNAMKLPGLQKYLSQNLGHPVAEVQSYRGMEGAGVVDAPVFKSNLLSFAVCYGLVLQGLENSKLSTNLLPPEIVTDRMIREKKPWAVAMVAALLLGIVVNFGGHWRAWRSVQQGRFAAAESAASGAKSTADSQKGEYDNAKGQFEQITKVGEGLVGNVDGRLLWPEMLSALNQCLPSDPPDKRPDDPMLRNEIHIGSLQCEWFADLTTWYSAVREKIEQELKEATPNGAAQPPAGAEGAPGAAAAPVPPGGVAAAATPADAAAATPDPGPSGPGWVIQLRGYHYHNKPDQMPTTASFVRRTLIENLRTKKVNIPDKDGKPTEIAIKDLGIGYPVITSPIAAPVNEEIDNDEGNPQTVSRFDFTVQFAWRPTPLGKRGEQKQDAQQPQPELAGGGGP
jgi:type IV pilus assembly protein PilM